MKISIIGSGNVATHMAMAMKLAGNDIIQVYSHTLEHAQVLAGRLGCDATESVEGLSADADVYVFSIKDDHIRGVAERLAQRQGFADKVFIHTAGSIPMDVFRGLTAHYGVLYPMQTLSKSRSIDFRKVPCFTEASDPQTMDIINELADGITDRKQEASSETRRRMHLAAVFASNMTNHCYRMAERIVSKEGIDFSLFLPLIEETAKKVTEMKPKEAQTGPMVRNDIGVMNSQLELLEDERMRSIYRLMAESIYND